MVDRAPAQRPLAKMLDGIFNGTDDLVAARPARAFDPDHDFDEAMAHSDEHEGVVVELAREAGALVETRGSALMLRRQLWR